MLLEGLRRAVSSQLFSLEYDGRLASREPNIVIIGLAGATSKRLSPANQCNDLDMIALGKLGRCMFGAWC